MADSHVNDPDPSGMAMPGLIDAAEPAPPASAAAMGVSPILTGHVGRALLWLALPVLAEQALNICVGMTDIYLAGYVGSDATVAVGLAAHFGWLIVILFGLIGTAATALVARAIGRQAYDEANHVANQAVALGAGMGIVATAAVIFVAPWIPRLFGLESQAAGLATRYIRIDAIGHVLGGILGIGNACMRGAGDTRTPLRVMAIVNLCNVVVSAVLTLGIPGVLPRLGVVGIATGTACARIVGGLLVVATLSRIRTWFGPTILFGRTAPLLTLHRRQMRLQRATLHRLLRIGAPAGADGIALWVGQLLFVRIINGLAGGDLQTDIYAAHIIGIRIESLSYLPAFAWGIAAATMVGQSLGARDPSRASRSGHLAAAQGAALTAMLGALYFLFAPQLYGLFTDTPRVIAIGVPAFRMLAFFQIPCALMIIYPGALRGAGDTRYPLLFTLLGMMAFRLPLAWFFGHAMGWGLCGAWIGMCADMTLRATLGAWRFAHGGWKRTRV